MAALVLLASTLVSFRISSNELLSLYIGLELTTIPLFVLAAFFKDDKLSVEAGMKYFVIGAFSSALLLYGISFLYGMSGTTDLLQMKINLAVTHLAFREIGVILIVAIIMVVAGMIFGFPDDEETDIIENYQFLKSIDADTSYCQILTPYPKTGIRQHLLDQGLITNPDDFSTYNGIWANVKTRHLDPDQLQYLFWYHRQKVMGWWEPSERVRSQGRLWTAIWVCAFRPLLKVLIKRSLRKYGWRGRYDREIRRQTLVNVFPDLEGL